MRTKTETFTFFYHGPFSQWHPSPFVIEGQHYYNAEQYMMAGKARLFGDKEILARILAAEDPMDQKRLGRVVSGFKQSTWEAVARDIVHRGSIAKFAQNPGLLSVLSATAGTTLVEVSPFDKIWGIGLPEGDPRTLSRAGWLGTNWLGEVLTCVRKELTGA